MRGGGVAPPLVRLVGLCCRSSAHALLLRAVVASVGNCLPAAEMCGSCGACSLTTAAAPSKRVAEPRRSVARVGRAAGSSLARGSLCWGVGRATAAVGEPLLPAALPGSTLVASSQALCRSSCLRRVTIFAVTDHPTTSATDCAAKQAAGHRVQLRPCDTLLPAAGGRRCAPRPPSKGRACPGAWRRSTSPTLATPHYQQTRVPPPAPRGALSPCCTRSVPVGELLLLLVVLGVPARQGRAHGRLSCRAVRCVRCEVSCTTRRWPFRPGSGRAPGAGRRPHSLHAAVEDAAGEQHAGRFLRAGGAGAGGAIGQGGFGRSALGAGRHRRRRTSLTNSETVCGQFLNMFMKMFCS